MSPSMTMDDYRKLIADVMASSLRADATGPQVFENFGPDHARAVVEAMIRAAKESVCIYAEKVSRDVYDPDLFMTFLARNPTGKVRILVERDNVFSDSESALNGQQALVSERFEVRLTPQHTDHLAVIDGIYARVEESQSDRKALVSFGKNALCESALGLFNSLWEAAAPLATVPRLGEMRA